ncbi:hypothetical protein HHUSO_G29651 [Huso huso]|uniref:Reverse transcriptase domain-containing protein n=1 Tax=Huso huso TaxID=61971 RepID=A0ABR0YFT7_HUSHU
MREGCISLLYKKGDKKEIKNWRPVTLLCVDLKILSKVVFLRLQSVISSVVNSDQTCGIPGRLLTDSLALVRDIIEYVKDRNVPLCLLSLDQEKAFDRLNHSFIMSILVNMNFGPAFCSWIHLLYKDCFSRIIINGVLSEPFKVLSGVRQGCPLSPLLFVLGMEPLACAIRQDCGITGIIAPGSGKQDKLALLPVGTLVEEDCRTVWRNVSASYLLNAHRDLAWSVVHQCLPLRSFLYRRGGTASPVCIRPGCLGEETVHHLMWSCSFAQEVWRKMYIWLEKIERKIVLTEHGILYGLPSIKISKEKFGKIWSIINCTKDALWKARNILLWKKCALSAEAVYALALSIARDYVARDLVHRSGDEVSKIWGLEREQMVSQIVLKC